MPQEFYIVSVSNKTFQNWVVQKWILDLPPKPIPPVFLKYRNTIASSQLCPFPLDSTCPKFLSPPLCFKKNYVPSSSSSDLAMSPHVLHDQPRWGCHPSSLVSAHGSQHQCRSGAITMYGLCSFCHILHTSHWSIWSSLPLKCTQNPVPAHLHELDPLSAPPGPAQ